MYDLDAAITVADATPVRALYWPGIQADRLITGIL
jgi:hypothetical protein